jgi:hypothetical protein
LRSKCRITERGDDAISQQAAESGRNGTEDVTGWTEKYSKNDNQIRFDAEFIISIIFIEKMEK